MLPPSLPAAILFSIRWTSTTWLPMTMKRDNFLQSKAAAGFQVYPLYYPGYGTAFIYTQGQWLGYGFPHMPQYPTITMPQPSYGSRFVHFTSRTPCVSCTVSIVSIVFMNIFLREIYIGVRHLGLLESGRLLYGGYCIHVIMGEPR